MSRFGSWRRRRAGVWSHTVRAGRGRAGSRTGPPVEAPTPVLLPEAANRLADGVVVEAQLRARILGAPVLRIDGTVLVSPGQLVDDALARVDGQAGPARSNGARPGETLARAQALLSEVSATLSRDD